MEMQTEKMGFSGKEGVEEEGGVELNLCLSIGGGTSRMAPKAEEGETKGSAGLPPSSPLPQLTLYRRGDAVDRRRRREMQLLRRPEAHEQNMGIQRRRRNGATPSPSPAAGFCSLSPSLDDLLAPESKEDDRSRVSSREDGVEDAGSSNQKTREDPERGLDSEVKPELLPNANGSPNADVDYGPTFCPNSLNPNLPVLAPRPYPVMAMQSPFLQLQCLQVANGFGIPYLMPWWAPAMPPAAALPAVNEVRPTASSLAGKAVGTGGWMPHGSRSCSAMSDNVSHSFRDIVNEVPRSGESRGGGGDDDDDHHHHHHVRRRSSHHSPVENPPLGSSAAGPAALQQMPCVSTTGKGPNGKTITGLLYRYTAAEVSIVCVCHGSFFSPAEFVKHAGGTEMEAANPLRHITVVPF